MCGGVRPSGPEHSFIHETEFVHPNLSTIMRTNRRRCLPLLALLFVGAAGEIFAQQPQAQVVSGTVTSAATGQPLSTVNVRIKGTNQGTVTDAAGRFALPVRSLQDTLIFSLIGHTTREIPLAGRNQINVRLDVEAVQVAELVVTGYRVQERATVTGSVTSVSASDFEDVPVDALSNALAGRLAGVTVTQTAGTPGRESNIRVRAVGTFNNSSPLYVIDGVVRDKFAFDGLSPQEIESISILKDGAAASIYGSRAANGVILVTTRRGRVGAPEFSYSGTIGIQTPTRMPRSLNAYQHAKAINDALRYNNVPPSDPRYYTEDELEYFRTHSWDWIDELWRDPVETQHSLNVTGGTGAVRYFLSGSFFRGTGSFDNLSFERITGRANIDVDLTSNLRGSVDFSTTRRNRHGPSWGGNDWGHEDLYKALALRTRMVPPYINGLPVGNWVEWHPGVVIANESGYDKRDWLDLNARIRLEYYVPFIDGLSSSLTFNKSYGEAHRKQFNLPYKMVMFSTLGEHNHILGDQPVGFRDRSAAEFLLNRHERENDYQLNAQVNYRKSFGAHNVDGMFVYEQVETNDIWFEGRRDNFISRTIDQFVAGSSDPADSQVNGSESQGARISYVGSLAYNYARRYFIQGSFRYDGSVIFAPENRWGFFPSISMGWRISEEPFFNLDWVNELKLRASYGIVGNDAVGSFQWMQKYVIQTGAIFDNPTVGLSPGPLANRDITWEKSKSYNLGLDARFLNDRIGLTLDVFRRNTYDILGSRQAAVPSTFGASLPDENYQEIDSHGFEVELEYNGSFGSSGNPITYYLRGNASYATNEIIRLNEPENIRPYQSRIGRPTDAVFGYIATGILRTQEDLDKLPPGYTILGQPPRLGMLNYLDLRGPNSDEPDGRITSDDQAWIADHSSPPVTFGFTIGGAWKSLSIDAHFHGAAGHKHMMHENGRDIQARAEESSYAYWADSWTPENPDGKYPGYRGTGYRTRFDASTFWLRDASFVRLKNLTVSYELPQRLTNSLGVAQAKLYFTGTNLALLHENFKEWGFDPEASNIRAYPIMRTLSLGLNVTLRNRNVVQ